MVTDRWRFWQNVEKVDTSCFVLQVNVQEQVLLPSRFSHTKDLPQCSGAHQETQKNKHYTRRIINTKYEKYIKICINRLKWRGLYSVWNKDALDVQINHLCNVLIIIQNICVNVTHRVRCGDFTSLSCNMQWGWDKSQCQWGPGPCWWGQLQPGRNCSCGASFLVLMDLWIHFPEGNVSQRFSLGWERSAIIFPAFLLTSGI